MRNVSRTASPFPVASPFFAIQRQECKEWNRIADSAGLPFTCAPAAPVT